MAAKNWTSAIEPKGCIYNRIIWEEGCPYYLAYIGATILNSGHGGLADVCSAQK